MRHVVVALGAVALLATGCSDNTSSSPAASASSPTASASTWTVEEAGQHYLAMVEKGNADLDRLTDLPDSASLADVRSMCGAVADDMVAMLSAARSGSWPAQVEPLMGLWSKAVAEERVWFAECEKAETIADAHAALSPVGQRNSSDESALVRAALGLRVHQA